MKVGVLIPCFNGAETVEDVIKGALSNLSCVIVVDDGSSDNTYSKAKDAGVEVLQHPQNLGKGAALKTGFEYIKKNKDWNAVIIMDADGQHDWHEIPKFIDAGKDKKTGIVLGNRMEGAAAGMPWLRWLTNKFTSWVISKIAGQNIPDSQCGFRLIKTEVLRDIILNTARFDTESEMLIKAARCGYSIHSVPIKSIYRDERSYIHPVRDTLRFFRLIKSRRKPR